MPAKAAYSHDEYFSAFEQFLQTGKRDKLANYLDGDRPEAFLSVYRNGFIRASMSALESNFPTLVKLLGEELFSQVANAYVGVMPPASSTLIGYGFDGSAMTTKQSFVSFLQRDMPELITDYPYALDICRLDQAWLQALNENSEGALTIDTVQTLIGEGADLAALSMNLVDSAQVVNLKFDLFELWGQLRFGGLSEKQPLHLKHKSNSVIFWQLDLGVQAKPLSNTETVFVQSLQQSSNMDTASNDAVAFDESFDISALFAELLNAQLLKIRN